MRDAYRRIVDRASGGMAARREWWPVVVDYHAEDRDDAAWFASHFHTSLRVPTTDVLVQFRVHSACDPRLLAVLTRTVAGATTAETEGFAGAFYQTGHLQDVHWWTTGRGHGAHRAAIGTVDGVDWVVLSSDVNSGRRNGVRLVRELVRRELLRRGAIAIHGSYAYVRGQAVIFSGPSGAGKTTLAIAAARSGGLFIAGDRTYVCQCEHSLRAVGFPTVARIGFGTIDEYGLVPLLERAALQREQVAKVGTRIEDEVKEFGALNKLELNQLELEVLLSAPTAAAAPLRGIAILGRGSEGAIVVDPISAEEGYAALAADMLVPDPVWPRDWLASEASPPIAVVAAAPRSAEDVLPAVDWLSVRWRPRSVSSSTALRAVGECLSVSVDGA